MDVYLQDQSNLRWNSSSDTSLPRGQYRGYCFVMVHSVVDVGFHVGRQTVQKRRDCHFWPTIVRFQFPRLPFWPFLWVHVRDEYSYRRNGRQRRVICENVTDWEGARQLRQFYQLSSEIVTSCAQSYLIYKWGVTPPDYSCATHQPLLWTWTRAWRFRPVSDQERACPAQTLLWRSSWQLSDDLHKHSVDWKWQMYSEADLEFWLLCRIRAKCR